MPITKRVVVTLVFDVDPKNDPAWFKIFNDHVVDLLKHANAMPGLGVLVNATSTPGVAGTSDSKLNVNVKGVPTAGAPKSFTFCSDCPNTSWCRTQGHCERAVKLREMQPIGYLIEKSGINNGYYFVGRKEYAFVEERFRHIYRPVYAGPRPDEPPPPIEDTPKPPIKKRRRHPIRRRI